jgi:protein-S-isoprenylcysteine O-methyltransferase Ste14
MNKLLRGRAARPAPAAWNVVKTLLQTVVFWAFFLLLLPTLVYRLESSLGGDTWRFASAASRAIGIALFVLAGAIGLWSSMIMAVRGEGTPVPMDCPRRLVISGPYRFVRNPMALSGIAQGVGIGIALGSPAVIAYALAGAPFWNRFVRPWEEQDLEERFGAEFRAYRAAVRCWLPRLTPYAVDR